VATTVKSCSGISKCDASVYVETVAGLLLTGAGLVGAAFPPAGVAILAVAAIGLIVNSVLGAKSVKESVIPPINSAQIQDAGRFLISAWREKPNVESLSVGVAFSSY